MVEGDYDKMHKANLELDVEFNKVVIYGIFIFHFKQAS